MISGGIPARAGLSGPDAGSQRPGHAGPANFACRAGGGRMTCYGVPAIVGRKGQGPAECCIDRGAA